MSTLIRLVVACTLAASVAFAQTTKPAAPPPAVQKEFDAFLAKFRAALKANDSAAVASMTRLPLESTRDAPSRNAAEFRSKAYPMIFTARTRACLQRTKPEYDRDPDKNDNYMIFCGEEIYVFTRTPAGFRFVEIGVND